MKWYNFKKLMKNSGDLKKSWNYEKSLSNSNDLVQKNINIWQKRRNDICKYYSSLKNPIFINNIPYDPNMKSEKPKNIHLIFLLDSSGKYFINLGSMSGNRWNSLIDAVKISYDHCKDSSSIKTSVLTYNDNAYLRFHEEKPDPSLINKIPFTGGGTCFESALNEGYNLVKSTKTRYDKFVMCFISDGGCSYPQYAINNIISDNELYPKMAWYFISIDADMKLMNKMCSALNGNAVKEVKNLEELSKNFVEVINDCTN